MKIMEIRSYKSCQRETKAARAARSFRLPCTLRMSNEEGKVVQRFLSKFISLCIAGAFASSAFAVETTPYGKIVGIETREWGLHVQTNFAGGTSLGCPIQVGAQYMYDFDLSTQGSNANGAMSVLLAAFAAGKDVSFHLYNCRSGNTRPVIGHIRVR
jgi:hypothetical protein